MNNKLVYFTFVFSLIGFIPFLTNSNDLNEKIKEYLLKNPETIIESLERYESKKKLEKINKTTEYINGNKDKIFKVDANLFEGDLKSNKVIIEYFDYNCGYCKRAHKELKKLQDQTEDIKIIYKNLPILSDNSKYLARFSIAIGLNDNKNFKKFHDFILKSRSPLNEKKVKSFIEGLGLSYKNIKTISESKEVKLILEKNFEIANKLQIAGTPAFIIDNKLISGFIDAEEIKSILKY